MKKIYLSFLSLMIASVSFAQPLSGTYTIPGVSPTGFPTLTDAVNALNSQGVNGPVIFNVNAPQTAPAGGYIIGGVGTAFITTNPSNMTNTVTFNGNGNTVTAFSPQPVGSVSDAIIKIVGADYITISGFTLMEDGANTTGTDAATNNMTEFGIGIFYATVTDGAQNNTIQNNTITLNRIYSNTFGIFSTAQSSLADLTTGASATTAGGANSSNQFFTNNISNVNYGIVLLGSTNSAAAMDNNNRIGNTSTSTGNTITNAGSSMAALTAYSTLPAGHFIIISNHQINENISFNTINSASLSSNTEEGAILKTYSLIQPTGTTVSNITFNSVTVLNAPTAATGGDITAILNESALSALISGLTVNITNNTITGTTLSGSAATSTGVTLISNTAAVGVLNILNNSVLNTGITASTATTASIVGISNTSASATVNINDNILRNFSNTSAVLSTASIRGINVTGAITTALNINNNQFGNTAGNFVSIINASGSAAVDAIKVDGGPGSAGASLLINNNSITGISVVTAAQIHGIFVLSGFANVSVTNNRIGTVDGPFITVSGILAASSMVQAILTQGSNPTSALTITGNDIRGYNQSMTGASEHTFIENGRISLTNNISDNTFTNITSNTTGNVVFIQNTVTLPAGGSSTINNNSIVTAFNKTATGGFVRFYANFGASPTGTIHTNNTNNFSNVTVVGTTLIEGWNNHDGTPTTGPVKTISANTFTNITSATGTINVINSDRATNIVSNNIVSGISGQNSINGIILAENSLASTANGNRITAMSTTGAFNINGINSNGTATTTNTIFGNKICDITLQNATDGGVNGILVVSGDSTMMYNNIIGDLKAPIYTGTPDAVRGINIISTQPSSAVNVFFNTIRLSATSTGADFGSTALYTTASADSFTVRLDLRNNIINNNSMSSGAGFTAAFKRSGPALENYAVASNNNIFFAGNIPSPDSTIYFDQNLFYPTLAAFKAQVAPRETNSFTENTPFLSTTCADANFLHIPASGTVALDNAQTIASITFDFDLQGRPEGAGPDIGADEFVAGVVPVAIEYFRGSKLAGANYLEWKVNCINEPYVILSLERSADGTNFRSINDQTATSIRCQQGFNFTDKSPLAGVNYYRLKTTTADGQFRYSVIVALINREKGFELISISPNPVRTNATLSLSTVKGGIMNVSVSDVTGKVVMKQSLTVIAGNNPVNMNFSKLGAGTYNITVMNAENEIKTTRFVKY